MGDLDAQRMSTGVYVGLVELNKWHGIDSPCWETRNSGDAIEGVTCSDVSLRDVSRDAIDRNRRA